MLALGPVLRSVTYLGHVVEVAGHTEPFIPQVLDRLGSVQPER